MPKEYDVVSISDLKQIIGLIELRALFAIRDYYDTSKGNAAVSTMTDKLNAIVSAHNKTTTITTQNESSTVNLSVTIHYPALPFTVTKDSAGRPTIEYINGQTDTESSDDYFDFSSIAISLNGEYIDGNNIISYEQKVLSANDTIAQFIVNGILKTSYANLADYIHKHEVIDFYHDYTDVLNDTDTAVVNGSVCVTCISSCNNSCGNACTNSCSGSCLWSCSGRDTCGGCNGRCQGCSGWGACTPCTGTCGDSCSARCNGCSNSCGGGCSNSCGGGCSNCTGSCINLHSGANT